MKTELKIKHTLWEYINFQYPSHDLILYNNNIIIYLNYSHKEKTISSFLLYTTIHGNLAPINFNKIINREFANDYRITHRHHLIFPNN